MADCNAFEHCKWLRHCGKVMVLIVLAFVGLSVWAVVGDTYHFCLAADGGVTSLGCLLLNGGFLLLVGMLLWSYAVAVATDPGRVPPGWTPFADEEEASSELERLTEAESARGSDRRAGSGRPRYCRKCRAWKPPRAHHDSMTGACVLKMDHYCVWVLNCVGLLNYKAFLLFLLYACCACGTAAALLLAAFVRFLTADSRETPPATVFIAFVVDAAFCLCLLGFLAMHARLVSANCSTIEMFEKRRVPQWPYDRGLQSNFQEVFGCRWQRWLVPSYTEEEKAELLEGALSARSGRFEDLKLTELAAGL